MKYQLISYLFNLSEHININIKFWTLKMKYTRYEVYGHTAFKNAKTILFFEVGQSG